MSDKTSTALLEHRGSAKEAQEWLTLLQMVAGWKKMLNDSALKSLKYGLDIEKLYADNAANLKLCENFNIISLEFVKREGGVLQKLSVGYCTFDAAAVKGTTPEDHTCQKSAPRLSKDTGNCYWQASSSNVTERDVIHNSRKCIASALECCDAEHSTILLVPDKAHFLRNLQDIGFDLHESHRIIAIIDVRELHRAYLLRGDYSRRAPHTNNQRTHVHQSEKVPNIEDVWKALKVSPNQSDSQCSSFANLKAAVHMAANDICNPGWLHSREQVDIHQLVAKIQRPSSNAASSALEPPPLAVGANLPSKLGKLVGLYQASGQYLLHWLMHDAGFEATRNEKGEVTTLLVTDPEDNRKQEIKIDDHPKNETPSRIPYLVSYKYGILAGALQKQVPIFVAAALKHNITGRSKVHEWHKRLPEEDPRFCENERHHHHIVTLQSFRDVVAKKGLLS